MALATTRARRVLVRHGRPVLAAAGTVALLLALWTGTAAALLSPLGDQYNPQGVAYDSGSGTLYSGYGGGVLCRVLAVNSTGVVRNLAGAGLCGYSGDGGPATQALIEPPAHLAVDSSGNVYEASQYAVRRISHSTGTITDYAGTTRIACLIGGTPIASVGATASAVGMYTGGMAVDPVSGHLFVADMCTHAIVEIDESDVIVGVYGGTFPNLALGEIAFDAEGDLYLTSGRYAEQVRKLDTRHTFSLIAGNGTNGISGNGGPATLAPLDQIYGLAVDSRGVLFIATLSEYRLYIRQVSPEGTIEALAGTPWPPNNPPPAPGTLARNAGFFEMGQLAVDSNDNLYMSEFSLRTLLEIQGPAEPSSPINWVLHEKVQALDAESRGGPNPSENSCDQGCSGDPVNTATGEYWETTTDLAIPGRGPALALSRTYGSLSAAVDGPLGHGWTDAYAMSLSAEREGVVTITQENGSQLSFEPNGRGGYLAPGAYLATLAANREGGYTFTRRQRDRFVFDGEGRLVRELDLNGETTTLAYEGGGKLETITDPAGRTIRLAYDGEGHIREATDSTGRVVRYGYTSGDLTSVVDVRGDTWTYAYDRQHLLTSRTDPNRHLDVANEYDSDGRVARQRDAREGTTTFTYEPGLTQITSPERRVRQDYYASGQLIRRVDGAGTRGAATWSYEYDAVTHGTTKVTDPNGHVWRAAYNAAGLRTSTTDPLEHTTTSTYDELGDHLTFEDANHVTTTWTYDGAGNLLRASTPIERETQVTTYSHEEATHPGDVTTITDPRGKRTQLAYDTDGDVSSITDPLGNLTTMTYDGVGNLRAVVSPSGNVRGARPEDHTTSYLHDAAGSTTQMTDPLGHVTRWTYDPAGNLESTTDPKRQTTSYEYSADDLLTAIHRADESTLRRGYEADGNVTSTTDGAGVATRYAYDELGRLSTTTDPAERTTTYHYDAAGNTTSVVDPQGRTTTYEYDAANRLRSTSYSDRVTPNVTYEYDADGQRTAMSDGSGRSSYTYDALHRLTQHTDGNGRVLRYGYDLAGDLTSLTYANGSAVTRTFDDAGRLETVTDWLRGITRFEYDADSDLTKIAFPTASAYDQYSFDNADRMSSALFAPSGSITARLRYTRDEDGLLTTIAQGGLPGSTSASASYTSLNQLASYDSHAYEYDRADNLTELADARPLAYDRANELTEGPVPPGTSLRPARFEYDLDGNRTTATPEGGTATRLTYDQADRLASYTPALRRTTTYAYDGDGLRTAKTTSGVTTHFTWDRSGTLPLVLSDAANSYVYGPGGLPIEQIDGSGVVTYYHHDALGSTRVLSEARGATTGRFTYAPYGTLTESSGTQTTPLGFAGQYTDTESGLQYLQARYYDPTTGQFLTRDPLVPLTNEPYSYTDGSPLAYVDPSGLLSLGDLGMIISNAAAGALNEITFGFSNWIVGVDGSCAGAGYGAGSLLGFAGSLFDGGGEARLAEGIGHEAVVAEDIVQGVEHGPGVLGIDLKTRNYVNRANPNVSVHVDLHPTRHGGPHYDIHISRPKGKVQFPIGSPFQFPG